MTVYIVSNAQYTGRGLVDGVSDYTNRVLADGGTLGDGLDITNTFIMLKTLNIPLSSVVSATSASWGYKESDGKIVKLYNLSGEGGDLIAHGDITLSEVEGIKSVEFKGNGACLTPESGSINDYNLYNSVTYKLNSLVGNSRTPLSLGVMSGSLYRLLDLPEQKGGYISTNDLRFSDIRHTDIVTQSHVLFGGQAWAYLDGVVKSYISGTKTVSILNGKQFVGSVEPGDINAMTGLVFNAWTVKNLDVATADALSKMLAEG